MSGMVGMSGCLVSSSSGFESGEDLHAPPPAASVTASCSSARPSCPDSLDGEMLVDVPTDEFTSEAKEVLPAIRPLKINEAVQINIVRYICFSTFSCDRKSILRP